MCVARLYAACVLTHEQLLMQMFATLNYIQTRHPYGDIAGQPSQAPQADSTERQDKSTVLNGTDKTTQIANESSTPIKTESTTPSNVQSADAFKAAMRELAQELVVQEQKAEILINSLPGIGNNERDQRRRIEELQIELRAVEAERTAAEAVKVEILQNLDKVILSLKRGR